jgi:hypothetical protein
MLNRRTFSALAASVLATPRIAWSQGDIGDTMGKSFFYASLGPALTLYRIDVDGASLARQGTVMLPAKIQYAWPHPSAPFLYVATSNGGSASLGIKGDRHYLSALRIDPESGELQAHGAPAALGSRPIHVTVDYSGRFALVAYNNPSNVTVHRIDADGTVGDEVKQAAWLDCGIFAHQIRVAPSNDTAILVCRGNDAAKGKREDPGALKVFSFNDGQLTNTMSVAPNGGYGLGRATWIFIPPCRSSMSRASARTSSTCTGSRTLRSSPNPSSSGRRSPIQLTSARGRQHARCISIPVEVSSI